MKEQGVQPCLDLSTADHRFIFSQTEMFPEAYLQCCLGIQLGQDVH